MISDTTSSFFGIFHFSERYSFTASKNSSSKPFHKSSATSLPCSLTATQAAMSPCSSCSSRKNFSPPISVSSTAYHVPICPSTAMWSESPWIRPLLFCCCSSINSRTVNSAPVKFSPSSPSSSRPSAPRSSSSAIRTDAAWFTTTVFSTVTGWPGS